MSEQEDTYCRLCAELTPKIQLIFLDDDVAISSKILMKMLWINIDVSNSSSLPTSICFSCFDLLERTWSFLHNARTAQTKLSQIFLSKSDHECTDHDQKCEDDLCKPLNKDWDEFVEDQKDLKKEIKEDSVSIAIATINSNDFLEKIVKSERHSDDELYNDLSDFNSNDSDLPLQCTVKKRKPKKKKRKKIVDPEFLVSELIDLKTEPEAINESTVCTTWEDYMCRCAHCDAVCENISSLRLHSLQIHAACCIFKCSECGKVIGNHRLFVNHVRVHKKILSYCCEICNKVFSVPSYIKQHQNREHANSHLTMCQDCGTLFENPEQLQDHILIYSKSYRRQQKKDVLSEIALKCDDCNKEFKSRSNLLQHRLVHTERSRDFSCHVCGKMFFTKGTLSTHLATHDETKPYKCEFCPMAFRARGNLQSHISLHSASKPFVCEQCGKSFRVKRHLKSHSIVHTDLMPYVCEYCNKSFRFKTRLNLHLRQHTGAKPYKCIVCEREFTNGSNYKKHMKRRHNIDTSKKRYNNIVDEQGLPISEEMNMDSQ